MKPCFASQTLSLAANASGRWERHHKSMHAALFATRVAGALAISLVACAKGTPSNAGDTRTPQRDSVAVVELEKEWIAASAPMLERILAADFRHPVATGNVLTKAQHIAWVRDHPRPDTLHPTFGSLDVRVFGDAAVATGSVVTTGSAGREVGRNVFTDVFIFRDGRWQAVNAQETPIEARH